MLQLCWLCGLVCFVVRVVGSVVLCVGWWCCRLSLGVCLVCVSFVSCCVFGFVSLVRLLQLAVSPFSV